MKNIFAILLLCPAVAQAQTLPPYTGHDWHLDHVSNVRLARQTKVDNYLYQHPEAGLSLSEQIKLNTTPTNNTHTYNPPPQTIDVQYLFRLSRMSAEKRGDYLDKHRWVLTKTRDTDGVKVETYVYRFKPRYGTGRWVSTLSVVYEQVPGANGDLHDKLRGVVYLGSEPLVYYSFMKFLQHTDYKATTLSEDPDHSYPVIDYKSNNREFLVKRFRPENISFDFFSITYCVR